MQNREGVDNVKVGVILLQLYILRITTALVFANDLAPFDIDFFPVQDHCETARALKLCGSGKVDQLRFTVPRKSEAFQEDIYPPTFAGKPACTAEQWFDGVDMEPIKMSLDPSNGGVNIAVAASGVVASPSSMKTRSQLQKELDESAKYIAALIKAMEAAGLDIPTKDISDNTNGRG